MKPLARTTFILKLFLVCLLLMLSQRLLFHLFFREMFPGPGAGALLKAYGVGILSDASALAYYLAPFWLLLLFFNTSNRKVMLAGIFFFTLGFGLITLLNMTDLGYFPITKKRMGAEILDMMGEVPALLASYLADYWYLFILLLIYLWLAHRIVKGMLRQGHEEELSWKNRTISTVLTLFLLFAALRGGFAKRPFTPFDIPTYVEPELQWLAGNTPFQFLHTLGEARFAELSYMDDKEAENIIGFRKNYGKGIFNNKNVLIILLESFHSERIGFFNPRMRSYTPFLDSLLKCSRTYEYGMSNGRMTIDALPAVLSGIPSFMEKNYCYSAYKNNPVSGISPLLKKQGYQTAFYYGGLKSTFGFENYVRLNFSDNYVSQEDFTGTYENSGWGVDDHLFLPFAAKKLGEIKPPFCAGLLTLSLHHPFPVPEPYKSMLDTIKDPVKKCVKYTDLSLALFFKEISAQPWYKNSIIALCADHSTEMNGDMVWNEVNAFTIPIVLHVPGDSAYNQPQKRSISQVDIYPSILEYMGYPDEFSSLGSGGALRGTATIQYRGGSLYQVYEHPYSLEFDIGSNKSGKFLRLEEGRKLADMNDVDSLKPTRARLEKIARAYLQVFGKKVNGGGL